MIMALPVPWPMYHSAKMVVCSGIRATYWKNPHMSELSLSSHHALLDLQFSDRQAFRHDGIFMITEMCAVAVLAIFGKDYK
nr:hypothetical protein BaRGS_008629 [Batillaria attramentaria]